jgi:hypothetical protein
VRTTIRVRRAIVRATIHFHRIHRVVGRRARGNRSPILTSCCRLDTIHGLTHCVTCAAVCRLLLQV